VHPTVFEAQLKSSGTGHVAIYPLLLHRIKPDAVVYATGQRRAGPLCCTALNAECDEESLKHSQVVLDKNAIPTSAIKLLQAPLKGQILFPLLDTPVDITMCNPPFYASRQEMEESMDIKAVGPHAAPTASSNELITRGGEVAFISQMITESLELREKAT
jgi:methyltransferase